MAPSADPQLKGIGQTRGLEIWRINKFALEKISKEQNGNFYTGDSYIVLYTKNVGDWNVHFWLGNETSTDERGAAAIKTVELDDVLGGIPVQYREIQNYESSLFLSYFKDGIKYIRGGVASGFTHAPDKYENWEPRLFQCKGKRNVRCTQVDCKLDSLNLGDVFILDCGLNIYVWMPPQSGRLERIKGMEQARNMRDNERSGKPEMHALDVDWATNADFMKIIGCTNVENIKLADQADADQNYWLSNQKKITLWRVSDETGKMTVKMVSQGNFKYKQLESKDAFILDAGNGGIFVWVGNKCTIEERKKAIIYAEKYIEQMKKPPNTRVSRVLEGAEPSAFLQWASAWEAPVKSRPFEPKLYQCSDSTGRLVIEEIVNYTLKDLDGDDVMLMDTLKEIYVWIGNGANEREKHFAKSLAQKYLEGDAIPRPTEATIHTINQGHEPADFKKHFKH